MQDVTVGHCTASLFHASRDCLEPVSHVSWG